MVGTGIGRGLSEGGGRACLITTLCRQRQCMCMSIVNKIGNDVGAASCADVNGTDLIGLV